VFENKLIPIHIAIVNNKTYALFQVETNFQWFDNYKTPRKALPIVANDFSEAIRLAKRRWISHTYRFLQCGKLYQSHIGSVGAPALFYQLYLSIDSMNGTYLDPLYGHECEIIDYSSEAENIFFQLKKTLHISK
jgi:hypothetical protein